MNGLKLFPNYHVGPVALGHIKRVDCRATGIEHSTKNHGHWNANAFRV